MRSVRVKRSGTTDMVELETSFQPSTEINNQTAIHPWRRKWQPSSCLENSMDRRARGATGHGKKERNSSSQLHHPLSSAYPSQGGPTQLKIVPLTRTGKAGYMISYLSLLGLCVRNPLCLCPTQTPAELRQATEMAAARKKSKNSPTSKVPGDNPSSHWPALQRTQRFLSLRKSTSLEQPL